MDLLMEWVATDAFYNSDELDDEPHCHPQTRAMLPAIMEWVGGSESTRDDFLLWLFGPAGAGKTAIAKRIAEIAADKNLLIATFFFSKSSAFRNTKDCLVHSTCKHSIKHKLREVLKDQHQSPSERHDPSVGE
jgi:SpoVK/Ycf46/Vps4 family AAA+-type ATPase